MDDSGSLNRILENAKSLNRVACDGVIKVRNVSPNVVSQVHICVLSASMHIRIILYA